MYPITEFPFTSVKMECSVMPYLKVDLREEMFQRDYNITSQTGCVKVLTLYLTNLPLSLI